MGGTSGWLRRNALVLAAGAGASIPVIVSTVHAAAHHWLPIGDRALIAVRSYDVLSTHPPLVGPYSTSSMVIGKPVLSPGPLLYWLFALPVRLGYLGPLIAAGIVNVASIAGTVGLARRRGGPALMFAVAVALALMCGSLDASVLSDIWGPSITLLPFTLLVFVAWSVACGDVRLLPLMVLVASFVAQSHLTFALPAALLVVIAAIFLSRARVRVGRRSLVATAVVAIVCWSLPLAEEAVHRPGNIERIVQVTTRDKPTLGAADGWHTVVRAVGLPPWWLRAPQTPFARISDVTYAPLGGAIASAVVVMLGLLGVLIAAWRARRREVAAAAVIALALLLALGADAASTPSAGMLFAVVSYTLWWGSVAGMFAWLALGYGVVVLLEPRLRPVFGRLARPAFAAVALAAVALVGVLVALGGEPDRLENAFGPARSLVAQVRAASAGRGVVQITGPTTEVVSDLKGALAYGLRRAGIQFLSDDPPGFGTRYDPAKHPHDTVLEVSSQPAPAPVPPGAVAHATLVHVPRDAPPGRDGPQVVTVRVAP